MGLRFHRSVQLAPGIRLNLGLKSAGLSLGSAPFKVGYNTRLAAFSHRLAEDARSQANRSGAMAPFCEDRKNMVS